MWEIGTRGKTWKMMEIVTQCVRSAVMLTGKYLDTVCWYLTESCTGMYSITQYIYVIYSRGFCSRQRSRNASRYIRYGVGVLVWKWSRGDVRNTMRIKKKKRQLWVWPIGWWKLNLASCVVYLRFASIQQLHKTYVRTFARYIYLILTKDTGRWLPWMLPVSTGRFSTIVIMCTDTTVSIIVLKKLKYTPAVRSKILSKLIFASCVWYSDRAYWRLCVLVEDISRWLPLQQLQCSYQGQQGDVRKSVRGNYKTRFWGGQDLRAVEGNASISLSSESCESNIRWEEGGGFKDVGAWFWSKGGREGKRRGRGRVGQVKLCVEILNSFRGGVAQLLNEMVSIRGGGNNKYDTITWHDRWAGCNYRCRWNIVQSRGLPAVVYCYNPSRGRCRKKGFVTKHRITTVQVWLLYHSKYENMKTLQLWNGKYGRNSSLQAVCDISITTIEYYTLELYTYFK